MSKVGEAPMTEDEAGVRPGGEGWFILNVAEAAGLHTDEYGEGVRFEGASMFPDLGINIRRLEPGQPSALYHRESSGEAFLVLSGECLAVVENVERPMRKGDFLYTPAGVPHVVVGAGDGPSIVLMAGARRPDLKVTFPASETAAAHGASVEKDTDDAAEAYSDLSPPKPARVEIDW